MSTTDVGLLVRAAAAGDEDSWNALVDEFTGLIWTVARSFRLDETTSADVVQECWCRLASNLDRIREPERIAAWLTSTAKHEALRVLRIQDRQRPTDFDDERLLGIDDPADEALIDEECFAELYDALLVLAPRCQQLLRLLVAEPKIPYEDIADIVGMPVGSIGPTRARCLDKLRDLLQERSVQP
ncbi:MAG: RNA polymerase sigma factor [Acidimicrobiales bacterium]